MRTQDQHLLSVVIATLGGQTLSETIKSINSGSIVPDEIIISIPEKEAKENQSLHRGNVKILAVKVRGQVAQRCEGFKLAQGKFVLQVDDDIILEKNCIEHLIKACKSLGVKSACAPSLYFLKSGKSVYSKPVRGKFLSALYYGILNGSKGYQEGSITLAGTEIGVDPSNHSDEIIKTEWIPGGIALHYKENLLLDNYYPHHGKAFSEDLYHSIELRKHGINLFIVIPAIVWIDDPRAAGINDFSNWFENLLRDYNARKHLVKTNKRSFFRMNSFYFVSFAVNLLKRI